MAEETKGTILMIDDNVEFSETIQDTIAEYSPFATILKHTGQEGLNYLADEEVDLILLDIRLPDMTGLEVLQKIRDLGVKIHVIILTGEKDTELREQASKLDAFEFMEKPVKARDLLILLDEAMRVKFELDAITNCNKSA